MSDDYLDFRPIASRRPHVRAYLEYMYPDLGHTLDWRWKVANGKICLEYYFKHAKKVQAPVFDFLVDHEVWETFFDKIKSKMAGKSAVKIPQWPFKMTSEMMQDSQPSSREYSEYLKGFTGLKRKRAKRESLLSDISANADRSNASSSSVPQVSLPALNLTPDASSNDATASVSQAPSTVPPEINPNALTVSLPQGSSAQQRGEYFWKLAGGDNTFRPPIIGPFQMKLPEFAPLNSFVTGPDFEDLKRITTDFLPRGLSLKVEITSNEGKDTEFHEVLTLGLAKGCGDKAYDRAELLRFWGYMTEWLSTVYHGAPTTLREHLHKAILSPNRKLELFLHHNTTSTELAPSTRSYSEMANDDDKQKQVHDDKKISGTLLHVLPHNAFKHPPSDRVVYQMDRGMVERYFQEYIDHRWMAWSKRKKPDYAVHVQAKLYRHPGTADKDEVKWKIEYDEEAFEGGDDMLSMEEPKEETPVGTIA
ncbi:hypothetical protein FMUND_10796 [Fusarium mundagurra]|uniref:Uncharacterized protein n=1 Tax=Fusarium mundagurra TaxID=1567541 RepID=A0A8H5Y8Q9_9HYPO|nr:hypothetical protein FMUND_10796 [Fusarium mundagurra]